MSNNTACLTSDNNKKPGNAAANRWNDSSTSFDNIKSISEFRKPGPDGDTFRPTPIVSKPTESRYTRDRRPSCLSINAAVLARSKDILHSVYDSDHNTRDEVYLEKLCVGCSRC